MQKKVHWRDKKIFETLTGQSPGLCPKFTFGQSNWAHLNSIGQSVANLEITIIEQVTKSGTRSIENKGKIISFESLTPSTLA